MLKSCVYIFMRRNYEFQYQKSMGISKININGTIKIYFKNLILKNPSIHPSSIEK